MNGNQNEQSILPVSVPSLVIGQQHDSADTPECMHPDRSSSSSLSPHREPFKQLHNSAASQMKPSTLGSSSSAEVPGPSGQEEDEWDVLLRYTQGIVMTEEICMC